jgi:hypothetical protein
MTANQPASLANEPRFGGATLQSHFLPGVLLLLLVLLSHSGSLHGEFLLDDTGAIAENKSIRSLRSIGTVLREAEFTTVIGRPLLNLSLALNYAVHGVRPEGYHVVNYVLHVAVAFMLYLLVRRVLSAIPDTQAAARPLAMAISGLWCVHPLTINGVSYIVQRGESLASLFYLTVSWGFVKGVQTSQRRWFVIGVLAGWLGGLTKETIATAPLALIALDGLVVTRNWREAFRRHWRVYLCNLSLWPILALCMFASKARAGTVGFEMGITAREHLQTQVWAFAHYLKLSVWPHPLIFDYGGGLVITEPSAVMQGAMIVVLFFGMLTWLAFRKPAWAFPGIALSLLLGPTLVIPIVSQTVAEHRMCLASAGVVAWFVLALFGLLRSDSDAALAGASRRSLRLAIYLIPVALLLIMRTRDHTRVLVTNESMWADTVVKQPSNQRALFTLAKIRAKRDPPSALQLCDEAIALQGRYTARAFEARAGIWIEQGELQKALDDLTQAIQWPGNRLSLLGTYQSRAMVLRDLHRHDEALLDLDSAEALDPRNVDTNVLRASISIARQEPAEALRLLNKSLARDPDHFTARYRRAMVLKSLDRWPEAFQDLLQLRRAGYRIEKNLFQEVQLRANESSTDGPREDVSL